MDRSTVPTRKRRLRDPEDPAQGRERNWLVPGLPRNCPLHVFRRVDGRVTDGGDVVYVNGLVAMDRTSDSSLPNLFVGSGYYAGKIHVYAIGSAHPGRHYGGAATGTIDCQTGFGEFNGFSSN